MADIDLEQVQSNVLRGYRHDEALKHAHYDFIEFPAGSDPKAFVRSLLKHITYCPAWNASAHAMNLGLTGSGLDKLAAPERASLPEAFRKGMTRRAEEVLFDTGPSAPANWDAPFGKPNIDAVISLSSPDEAGLQAGKAAIKAAVEASGVSVLATETAAGFDDKPPGTEHFGFVDGIGQPFVDGSGLRAFNGEGTPTKDGNWKPIPAGEFVLGYTNARGEVPLDRPLLKNGSFMVFRKLQENVVEFRNYVKAVAEACQLTPEVVSAKMVGRWQNGTSLVQRPDGPDTDNSIANNRNKNNDFRYADDPHGLKCPFGAHVRRANPRDDKTGPGTTQVSMHRIIRRALPYGPWLPEAAKDDGTKRGVLFVVINADIVEQFEYVQNNWMNDVISSGKLTNDQDRDPLIGANDGSKFLIPGKDGPAIAWDLPRFVETRGGEYFFLPSKAALEAYAAS